VKADASVPVSVVIPAHNAAGTIARALASAAAQTAEPAEIIVVDDASTDETVRVVLDEAKRHPAGRVRVLRQERNRGPGSARNRGWDSASGRYIAFLDADDAWHPKKLEFQCVHMKDLPDAVLMAHPCATADPSSLAGDIPASAVHPVLPGALLRSNTIATSSVMLRRDLRRRFAPDKRYAEDYLLWLQIALSGEKMYFIDAPLAHRFKPPFGAGGLSKHLWRMERGVLDAYREIYREGLISLPALVMLAAYSLLKYARRVMITKSRLKTI
jgi:glycosyltransferase involved in cell wall biosynthesis